ncbi:MAG: hypoxanthine phosphoribosyltransferase [Oscillospiraceae bacterium]|nr:hypoxanthine phosphoribosyltransferase [Oscillospiraceae bacterium]
MVDTLPVSFGYENIKRVIIPENELKARIAEVGKCISLEYSEKPLLLIAILKGSFIFLADLCREITVPCEVEFMRSSSYVGNSTVSTGNPKDIFGIDKDISKYHVLLVEDIVDTGKTLVRVTEQLKKLNPLSLKVCTLLDKPERREVDFSPDFALFTVPDVFVVGYGLDFDEKYRNLPYIAEVSL